MTLPKLLTTADIAKLVGRDTQWVRRRLKKMGVAAKVGRLYETTHEQLAELYRPMSQAVLASELPDVDEDTCPNCVAKNAEVAALEMQIVELDRQVKELTSRLQRQ